MSLPESSQPLWWMQLSGQHLQPFTILYIKSRVEPKGNHMHWISDLWPTPKMDTYEYDCFLLTQLWWIKFKSTKPVDKHKFLGQILWNCNNSFPENQERILSQSRKKKMHFYCGWFLSPLGCHLARTAISMCSMTISGSDHTYMSIKHDLVCLKHKV